MGATVVRTSVVIHMKPGDPAPLLNGLEVETKAVNLLLLVQWEPDICLTIKYFRRYHRLVNRKFSLLYIVYGVNLRIEIQLA